MEQENQCTGSLIGYTLHDRPVKSPEIASGNWEVTGADGALRAVNDSMFHQMFERSADAIFLFDPGREVFVDCNCAAVKMMRASSRGELLMVHPANLSPEFQPDGQTSREKTTDVINLAISKGSYRFEWRARRMDGTEFPLEVLLTPIEGGEHPLMATVCRDITERKAADAALRESEQKFRQLFEASCDAIQILDPGERRMIDCNDATVQMVGGGHKSWLLQQPVDTLSPERQPDGRLSREVGRMWAERALTIGPQRFEWLGRRHNGEEFPVEVLLTPIRLDGRKLLVSVSREISERKKNERELLELNQSLERHVAERTAALTASEARFRALVEHAPEAIVVFDGVSGRFLFGNEHACRLYGVPMEKLTELTPMDVSPALQPGGRCSSQLAREKMDEALNGGKPVFEWIHRQQPEGKLIPTEVRLLRLPAEGLNLIRASIIDNTERKLAERALRESEQKFRALFERSGQGILLHDEEQIFEVNPAAVRIMGCSSSQQLLGKHPAEASPPFQPGGESSPELARKYIQECMATGSARFDWVSRSPDNREIPIEVTLTPIQWGGRHVIQALISDISERKKAEAELRASEARLRESEARFSAAFKASPVFIAVGRMDNGQYVLANEAFLKWTDYQLDEVLGHTSLELGLWADPSEREPFWEELRRTGSIRERECRTRNRHGKFFTMLISADVIEINSVPHLLTVGLDITERKQAEAALRASEARLRESEARFSAAFHASPIITGITRASDARFVLVNDAALDWLGCTREEVLGRTALELGVWESWEERDRFWENVRSTGSIRQWECRLRNRRGQTSAMLASGVTIEINGEEHRLIMMVDITERKKAEAELQASEARLRESEARFSAAFHASPVITAISRASDGKFVLANDAFLNWAGYERNEVLGRTAMELGVWENTEERKRFWDEVRSAGSIRAREYRLRNRRGRYTTMLASGVVIAFQGEDHLLGIMLDITQRKQAESELHRALARELELNELKSNFVSMVSHEFRTPLGIIQSSAELLRDFYERMEATERGEQLESITRNARRMAAMMEEILVLSRLDAGKLDFKPAALDLNGFFRRVVDEVLSATNRCCAIAITANGIPVEAQADERLLGHIFTNLLSNAVKYSEPGTTVSLKIQRSGKNVICAVQDRGIGISEEDQQRLFKAFHRGSNVGNRPGTGLGLLLVKRCAELHGGDVLLNSKIGEGTTVTITIPAFSGEP